MYSKIIIIGSFLRNLHTLLDLIDIIGSVTIMSCFTNYFYRKSSRYTTGNRKLSKITENQPLMKEFSSLKNYDCPRQN